MATILPVLHVFDSISFIPLRGSDSAYVVYLVRGKSFKLLGWLAVSAGWGHLGGVKVKVKFSLYRPIVAQSVGRGIALLFHDRGTRRG